ncbi:MAG TPA: NAD(+) synthase [Polyangiaceae bacterium]|nr:NAD(+) synthase [Polyangiaceae bacterium]
MKLIKVAAAALNQTPLDWAGNCANILAVLAEARKQGVSVLCLPELCITGYGCEDAFLAPGTQRTALEVLAEVQRESRGIVVCVGLPLRLDKAVFNACALLADGKLCGFVAKRALAGDGLHYEPRWFKAWPRGKVATCQVLDTEARVGDVLFDVGGVRLGFEICEDAWIAERPGGRLARHGVDLILNPSASHFAFGKHEVRRRLVLEGSRAFGVSYLYANLLGNEAGRAIYDGDALIATAGAICAESRRFSYRPYELVSAVIDVELTRTHHTRLTSFRPALSKNISRVAVPFDYPACRLERNEIEGEAWEGSPRIREEEFGRAVSLALFDYLRKSRSRGFVVSLSGGADSSAITCLVASMVELACKDLGVAGVQARLGYLRGLEACRSTREIVGRLLTTLYQSTRNSGPVTRAAASGLAEAVGARHFELEVDSLVQGYVALGEKVFGRSLAWETDDIALQNIQARVRAPSAWLVANVQGALLLSTSNRSEAAVGYATMDGDTAGSISPIAGIDKAFLRRWLVWLESEGLSGLAPIPALQAVNQQSPTAELRPPGEGQTDEGDLMPYDVLDAIERAAIRDKRSPSEILEALRLDFPERADTLLVAWITRFFRLFCRNQWKRERYAPSFHLDDESLDPKTWYRFPILSGGFERELGELSAALEATSRP